MATLFTMTVTYNRSVFGDTRASERQRIELVFDTMKTLIGNGASISGNVELEGHTVVGTYAYTPVAST